MTTFTLTNVDGPGTVNGQACLALTKDGHPRIAYAATGGRLMLASRAADGKWSREELVGAGGIGLSDTDRVCLEIDSQGSPHIAYRELASGNLLYGVERDGGWTFTPVPTALLLAKPGGVAGYAFGLYRGGRPELLDTPHFAYSDSGTGKLGYTRRVEGSFRIVEAAGGGDFTSRLFPSIAFDELSGTFVIAYTEKREQIEPDPENPPRTRVRWIRVVDPLEGTFGPQALLDDRQFNVVRSTSVWAGSQTWVAYGDATTDALKAATLIGEEASRETVAREVVAAVPSLARNGALAGSPEDTIRIAYADDNKVKLAKRARGEGWTVEVVDPSPGTMPSLAYDKFRNAHLAYAVNATLMYATGTE